MRSWTLHNVIGHTLLGLCQLFGFPPRLETTFTMSRCRRSTQSYPMRIDAPFTPEQVVALNNYQTDGRFHEFTCGVDSRHPALVATATGWVCPTCDYTQSWAHDFMLAPAPETNPWNLLP